jgi:hypothetical protein
MIDERQYIQDILYDFVSGVVAENGRTDPVIYADENGPRPVPPFISMEFTGGDTPGLPYYGMVDPGNGEQMIVQNVRKTLTMYAFGQGAFDLLETIRVAAFKNTWIDFLIRRHLVIAQMFEVLETGTDRDNEREKSASFDFDVTFNRVSVDTPGWIEHVENLDTLKSDGRSLSNMEE